MNNPAAAHQADLDHSNALADAARSAHWTRTLELVAAQPERVNASRIGGTTGFAPLHQAAYGGAPVDVAQALIDAGAYRTLRTTAGDRPVDIARQQGHLHLIDLLEPQVLLAVPETKLQKVEEGVHAVIRGRVEARPLLTQFAMRLPPLEVLTEIPGHHLWFPVPGMYGGFSLQLGCIAGEPICIVDSWIRINWGSEERRLVSTGGVQDLTETTMPFTIIRASGTE